MKGTTMLLLPLAVATLFLVSCGNSSPAAPSDTRGAVAPAAPDVKPTARSETGGVGQLLEPAEAGEVVAVIIDSCTWEPVEAGGPVELNLSFSVVNNSKKSIWSTFRVQNSSGKMYRPGGTASELTVNIGETGSRTIHTGKFPVGSEDLRLIISGRQLGEVHRVVKEEVALDKCTQP